MTTTSSSTSGSVLTALGLGSGLDIESLVSELTTAEMSGANGRIERQQESVTAEVSGIASLKSALSVFQASLLALTTGSSYSSRSASSSDEELLTAEVDSSAAVGTYRVVVQQIATAQQLVSSSFADGASTEVGTGELTIGLGDESFSVTIDSSNSTLEDIRDAINNASDNSSISASLVYGTNGTAQLLLTSNVTGADNTISVSASGGDGGLAALTYSEADGSNYTEDQAAQDAIITVAGITHQSASNEISDAIDGITFNLQEADPDTTVTVKVSNNTSNMQTLVESFISAYNTLNEQMTALGSYDSETETSGALLGDALYNNIQRQLGHALRDAVTGVSGAFNSLSSLGITTDDDGNLVLDDDKLSAALSSDFDAVAKLFESDSGILARFDSMLEESLASDGTIAARDSSLDRQQEAIDKDQELIDIRTAAVEARYLAKFNAMDTLLAQLQNTSDYLTQQFDALNKDSE